MISPHPYQYSITSHFTLFTLQNTLSDILLDALCEIEDITRFDYRKQANANNVLQFKIVLERQLESDIVIEFPVITIATQPSQWITHQLLIACGWQKTGIRRDK